MPRRLCRGLLGLARCFSSALSLGDRGKVMAQPGCVPGLGCHQGAGFAPLSFWGGGGLYLGSLICFCFVCAKPSPAEGSTSAAGKHHCWCFPCCCCLSVWKNHPREVLQRGDASPHPGRAPGNLQKAALRKRHETVQPAPAHSLWALSQGFPLLCATISSTGTGAPANLHPQLS